jgi:hypothetical protein
MAVGKAGRQAELSPVGVGDVDLAPGGTQGAGRTNAQIPLSRHIH